MGLNFWCPVDHASENSVGEYKWFRVTANSDSSGVDMNEKYSKELMWWANAVPMFQFTKNNLAR